ncbi:MAG: hypothetical protein JWM87_2609 [Candidatus Eremiobacteraeota bacterium]|nr:hypothetical protein [Candidatus Eremiobacteraeota bacterium]
MKRTLIELVERIESLDYQIPFGIYSGLDDFIEAIESSPEYRELTNFLKDSANGSMIQERAKSIIVDAPVGTVRSNKDTALAIYLLALSATSGVSRDLVNVADGAKQALWWAIRIAERVRVRHAFVVYYSVAIDESGGDLSGGGSNWVLNFNAEKRMQVLRKTRARIPVQRGRVRFFPVPKFTVSGSAGGPHSDIQTNRLEVRVFN